MHKNILMALTALFFYLANAPSEGADPKNGEKLHGAQCTGCHGSEVYTRADRRVDSLDALGTQVRFCINNVDVQWFDDETDDVIAYLNQSYYRFPER
jgi:mono/diheme cytochrome c family protein